MARVLSENTYKRMMTSISTTEGLPTEARAPSARRIRSVGGEAGSSIVTGRITAGSSKQYNIEILDNRIEQNVISTPGDTSLKLILDDTPYEPLQAGEIYAMEKFDYSVGYSQNTYYQLITNIFLRP